jgi:hypothetical protein
VLSRIRATFIEHRRLGCALALALGLLTAPVGGRYLDALTAAPTLPGAFRSLPASTALQTDPLLLGRVVRPDGTRARAGYVLIYAEAPRSANNRGAGLELEPVAWAPIAADGAFAARVDPHLDLRGHATDGVVNFQAIALTGDDVAVWGFPRRLTASGALRPEADSGPASVIPAELGASTDGTPASDPSPAVVDGASSVTLRTETVPDAARILASESASANCEPVAWYFGRRTVLGQVYHYRRGVTSRFNYVVGSQSTLGMAVKFAEGSWKSSGTTTRSSTVETTWRARSGRSKTVYYTHYDYVKLNCWNGMFYELKPDGYRGGAGSYRTTHRPNAFHCTRYYERGSATSLTRAKNVKWTNGVSVGTIIGFDLSAQSGWSERVRVAFRFKVAGRRLCGTANTPTFDEQPGFIVVRG